MSPMQIAISSIVKLLEEYYNSGAIQIYTIAGENVPQGLILVKMVACEESEECKDANGGTYKFRYNPVFYPDEMQAAVPQDMWDENPFLALAIGICKMMENGDMRFPTELEAELRSKDE